MPSTCSIIPLILFLFVGVQLQGQTSLRGRLSNAQGQPVVAASIQVKQGRSGATTDSAGCFRLPLSTSGNVILKISSVGYRSKDTLVNTLDTALLEIVLEEAGVNLGEVVVVGAGTFEASDKAKGASLTPIDAVTVAGNGGDIANALRSLPGAQQIGETEGLLVRGGAGNEAKQFVDGALLPHPNFSAIPGIPQPARLNPFLFKGILFSTGGYSALYGQAMSSALVLETVDLPDQSSASVQLFPMMVGAGIQQLSRDHKSSYGVNARYGNSTGYNKLIDARPDFTHGPEYASGDANFRIKTGKAGMLKFYTNYGYNHTGINNPDADSAGWWNSYVLKGINSYSNLSWRSPVGTGWKIEAVLAYNYYKEDVYHQLLDAKKSPVVLPGDWAAKKNAVHHTRSDLAQARTVLSRTYRRRQALRVGAEYFYAKDGYRVDDTAQSLQDHLVALFAETDLYIIRNLAFKVGLRTESSTLLQQLNWAPRIGLAYRFKEGGQLNAAYGIFYQKPENRYLLQQEALTYTRSDHFILNYQYKFSNRLLRLEAYYKKYYDLITTTPGAKNEGDGYAKGVELFFRDKRTFKNVDYWVSYTYLDTKRQYLDYPARLQPAFATPHTVSLAVKRFFRQLNLSANGSFTWATGRPYYNLQKDATGTAYVFDQGTTNQYAALNLSFAYLFTMFKGWKNKDFSGIGFGMNNVFGRQQVFGYNYSFDGLTKLPVTQPALRTWYAGLFMSFGIDRRDDLINENL
ncbi:TonB-dependent receptor [Paraflavitalea sp. CAU 1676]|uniref:TonB-dependent receptor n=1 Tax=Paraflavitalea sp. CAU 1676 TaxID=3032598 RepID=UPI0023DC3163|nr:TonB-dependent receptor [Paraflavitalea sp. CAU 1676]MDF2188065.1 TonB-dependent receptor [Paraflavitalea sp. CAU 1676]